MTIPPIQYSNLQLVLGNYDIEPSAVEQPSRTATTAIVKPGRAWLGRRIADDAEATPLSRTIVATRLRATNLRWVGKTRSFVWDRVPLALRALRPDGKSYEPWQIDMKPSQALDPSQLVGDTPARAANHIPWPVQTQVREEGSAWPGVSSIKS